jgi:predicted MPP superfamily phosphohydrolase
MSSRRSFLKKTAVGGVLSSLLPTWVSAGDSDVHRSTSANRVARLAHITDVHMLDKKEAEEHFALVLKNINQMADKPDFIINTGDTVMDENKQTRETVQTRWNVWDKIVQSNNKLAIKSCLGNHDVWYGPDAKLDTEYKKDKRYGKQWAIDVLSLPQRYYSFDQNGWHFIALDSINGEHGYQLDKDQLTWLSNDLDKLNKNTPVLVFSHVPILSMGALLYATKRNPVSEVKFPSGDMHNDHQIVKVIFFRHKNVKLCLSGHVHYIDAIEYLGVKYLCNGAVSGNWWGDPLSLDEFPPVYSIIDLYEDGSSDHQLVYYTTPS